ncbi:hypothetical protein CBU02nite_27970 [Clostridium butyricum]|uniref:Tail spike domain-containing protein n=1 Tax=Clostridium butyricum TaxID=1492 RepID=A0A512TQG0_CLOBU|nr:phage tail spike protein [Clostridium butyricum]NOW21738.1 phage minor structural protein [Clostridium butyricum]GEQ22291.1 hypothetical protein CBU02nite_27970 [Clostridium butyricum]
MIRLFKNTETDFSHNENVLSEVISCKVTEEINGDYTLELEYPLEDSKSISSNLVTGAIISVPTIDDRENQRFRIIEKETDSDSTIVQAQAKLLADLKANRIKATTITGKTRNEAITTVLGAALESHDYTVGNYDISTDTSIIVSAEEGNLLTAIIGDENSILSEYGGEFIVDNDNISVVDSRGSYNGVVIEYGKNLSSIKETIDLTDLATVLIPKSGDYRLPEYFIESPLVGNYEKRYFQEVELSLDIYDPEPSDEDDVPEMEEGQVTVEEAYTLMRIACNNMFNNDHVDQITFNYTVDMIELSKTEEYKDYAILEKVNLGDTVNIKHKKLNLNLTGRVNKISYRVNSNGETFLDTIEIGFTKKSITDIISDTVQQIQFAKNEIVLEVKNNDRKTTARLDLQEDKINAVVEKDGTGMGWELSQEAFKVACVGASGSYVIINADGLEVHDGKFRLYKGDNVVFHVNTRGVCNAEGGFVVDDGDTSCTIDASGIELIGENGNTAKIEIIDDDIYSGTYVRDDLYVEDVCRVLGTLHAEKNLWVGKNLYINGDNILDIIQDMIDDSISSSDSE